MTRAIVFDLGGVLCRFVPAPRLRALSAATGLAPGEVEAAVWGSGLDARAEAGELRPAETVDAVRAALGGRLDGDELRAAWAKAFVPDEAVCDLASAIAGDRFAFTNNGPLLTACLGRELQNVAGLVHRVVCSWELRARKPDPRAFARLADELRRAPHDLILIDDALANCLAAESIGMRAIHFRDEPGLRRELTRLDVRMARPDW